MPNSNFESIISGVTFEEIFKRLVDHENIKNYADLARLLSLSRASVSRAKKYNHVPYTWQERFERVGYYFNWVCYGKGDKYYPLHSYFHKDFYFPRKIINISRDGYVRFGASVSEYPISKKIIESKNIKPKYLGYYIVNEYNEKSKEIYVINTAEKNLCIDKSFMLYIPEEGWVVKHITKNTKMRSFFEQNNEKFRSYVFNNEAVVCGECVCKLEML